MSRLDPKNREEAYAHQFEDSAKALKALAMAGSTTGFQQSLKTLSAYIKAYKSGKAATFQTKGKFKKN